ncbi:MAG: hypothetical protein WC389_05390 [Lutibacter sp.]|jgi:hypothetical protein
MKPSFIIVHNDADTSYSADDIIGKTLIAKQTTSGYNLPNVNANKIASYKPGSVIGVVYSFIQNTQGLFWVINLKGGKSIYLLHAAGKYSIKALKDQGAKTDTEKAREQAKKDAKEAPIGQTAKLQLMSLLSNVKILIIIALSIVIVLTLLKYFPISKILKK